MRATCGVIVTELFTNALDHGVLGLSSSLKDGAHGLDRYYEARAAALAGLEKGSIAVHIASCRIRGRPVIEMQFRDSGAGFGAAPGRAVTDMVRHGRGIDLLRALCTKVEFHNAGNDVRVTYALGDPAAERLRAVA